MRGSRMKKGCRIVKHVRLSMSNSFANLDCQISTLVCRPFFGAAWVSWMSCLDELLERSVKRRSQRLDLLVEVNGSHSTLCDSLRCEFKLGVDLLVRT